MTRAVGTLPVQLADQPRGPNRCSAAVAEREGVNDFLTLLEPSRSWRLSRPADAGNDFGSVEVGAGRENAAAEFANLLDGALNAASRPGDSRIETILGG
jgi:hypothetical protein